MPSILASWKQRAHTPLVRSGAISKNRLKHKPPWVASDSHRTLHLRLSSWHPPIQTGSPGKRCTYRVVFNQENREHQQSRKKIMNINKNDTAVVVIDPQN